MRGQAGRLPRWDVRDYAMSKATGWLREICARFKRFLKSVAAPRDSDDDASYW